MTRGRSTGALTSGGTRVQHLTHSSDQHPGAERLLEIDYPLPKGPALDDGLFGVPRHEEHGRLWTIPLELLGKAGTAHPRHHDVGEKEVNRPRVRLGELERLVAVG